MHKTDDNHYQVANTETIQRLGGSVHHTPDQGNGFPDTVIGWPGVTVICNNTTPEEVQAILKRAGLECNVYDGANILVEIKKDDKASFTPAQIDFMNTWRGGYIVAWRPDQITIMPPWAKGW